MGIYCAAVAGAFIPLISFFLPSLHGGGAERVVVLLANEFVDCGHRVEIVLATAGGTLKTQVDPRVRVIELGCRRVITSAWALARYLRASRPQVIVSALSNANVVAVIATALVGMRRRLFVTEHAIHSLAIPYDPHPRMLRMFGFLMRLGYRGIGGVIAVSRAIADDLIAHLQLPARHIAVIHNPVVHPGILERAVEPLDHPWVDAAAPPLILAVGRLASEKEFGILLRAFALVTGRMAAHLVVLGEGPERNTLVRLAGTLGVDGKVSFPGFDENPYRWMRHAAVVVVSSNAEGFGNVLVEAMACGTPVVSTACPGGPPEILAGGRWGRLVPVGDSAALARAIEQTLVDPSPPNVVRRAADFSVVKIAQRYLDHFGLGAGAR